MIVLQDWSSHDFRLKQGFDPEVAQFGLTPGLRTNVRLKNLLRSHLNLTLEETYGTNLFPFIKPGNMSARIPTKDLVQAAKMFALPQIEIVNPQMVLALGRHTADVLRSADAHHIHHLPHPAARISDVEMDKAWQVVR